MIFKGGNIKKLNLINEFLRSKKKFNNLLLLQLF